MTGEVTRKGEQLVDCWLNAVNNEKTSRELLAQREVATDVARHNLATWMLPSDARVGEKICVWYGDSLIEVTVGVSKHNIRVRPR